MRDNFFTEFKLNKQKELKIDKNEDQKMIFRKQYSQNSQSFQYNDFQTKASSNISNGTHQTSFDFSESSYQNDCFRTEDFLREEINNLGKNIKKQLILKQSCFQPQFNVYLTSQINIFIQNHNSFEFNNFLQNMVRPQYKIFTNYQQQNTNGNLQTVKRIMQNLVVQKSNWFFIYTFDLVICPVTFILILIIFWNSPILCYQDKKVQSKITNKGLSLAKNIQRFQTNVRDNIILIVKTYASTHSQEISNNHLLLLLIFYFFDVMKMYSQVQNQSINYLQINLSKQIKSFGAIERNQKNSLNPNLQARFQQNLKKFQENHYFVFSPEQTYSLLRTHILQKFSALTLQKFYKKQNAYQNRKKYQTKKDIFCLWIVQNLLRQGLHRNHDILHISGMYIIQILGMLKKMKNQGNIEGISYLVPVVANIKSHLPKVWKHVIKRRPQIETKLNQYTNLMLKNPFKVEQIGQNGIIWNETIYMITEKMLNFSKNKVLINLSEHNKYYNQFLSPLLLYRQKAKQITMQNRFQNILQVQFCSGFNIQMVENYLLKKYENSNCSDLWNKFIEKSKKIDDGICESLLTDIFDYCFIGSTQKYKRVDI